MRRSATATALSLILGFVIAGCSGSTPTAPSTDSRAIIGTGGAASPGPAVAQQPPWAPATPPFNLQVVLHDVSGGSGFGLVKFRQPKDDQIVIFLDVWVRNLQADARYSLQRAVDQNLDGVCTSTDWLTLGKGLAPEAIVTDDRGSGRAELFRQLPEALVGARFDIHFRVVAEGTSTAVLKSDCYEFVASR